MHRVSFLCVSTVVFFAALVAATPARAQDLTAVQQAFVNPKPLTMMPEAAETVMRLDFSQQGAMTPAQGIPPAPQSMRAAPPVDAFKKAKFSKVFFYALEMTFYEHVMRVTVQPFTRVELQGKFWHDYIHSVKIPHHWADGDSWQVNYLGHGISGAAFSRIWLDQREPKATTKTQYFTSLGRAFLFTVLCSEQFEIGPMSEASIGNVGLRAGRTGWTDQVWTPIGAILWTMAEDAIDKYFLTFVDKHVPFLMARAAARMILNPSRMLANVGQNRLPWARTDRPIGAGLSVGK